MTDESLNGWYPCVVYVSMSSIEEAKDLSGKSEHWEDDWVADYLARLEQLSHCVRGCVVKADGERIMLVEKLTRGGVLGMWSLFDCRADSPNEAYRKAEEVDMHLEGPLVIRYMNLSNPRQPQKMH